MKYLTAILFLIICTPAMATIASEQSLRDSALQFCTTDRAFQAAQIIEENTILSTSSGNKIIMFSPHEKLSANFITGNYRQIIDDIKNGMSEECGYLNKSFNDVTEYYLDAPDTLERALSEELRKLQEQIIADIAQTDLSENEKQFLQYKLQFSAYYGSFCSIDKDALAEQLSIFALQNGDQKLSVYCNKITKPTSTRTLEAGTMLYSGGLFFTEDLASTFTNTAPIGIGFDFGFSRYHLFAQVGASSHITTKNTAAAGWDKNTKTYFRHLNLGISYNISQWDKVNISPCIGIHTSSLQTVTENSPFQSDSPNNTASGIKPTVGFAVDYNLPIKQCDDYRLYELEQNVVFIRFQTLYVANLYENTKVPISGDILFATIGIGIYTNSFF